jgi:hypothetical protein
MSKDNKDKESYQAGISNSESSPATKKTELYQDHPISTLDELLVGWLVKTEADPMPEILMINGTVYQKIKIIRYTE